ncbi:MAG: RnfABCDGE type electron transport complex subunit D [Clostridiales bacterium]|nr:RnfABCDGE type electron transport complex subunit D [Clostridiales bacterium]
MSKLVFSSSPHLKAPKTTKSIMLDVSIALLPATIVGIIFFGFNALLVMAISVVSAIVAELLYKMLVNKASFKQFWNEFDYTTLVTGLLIGMNMPPLVNWYIPIIASFFAIIVVKMLFGGTGKNIVNPAIAGRIFVFISFGIVAAGGFVDPIVTASASGQGTFMNPIVSGSTPLGDILKNGLSATGATNMDMFLGLIPGTIGETSALALIIGGIYLVVRDVIDWKWPVIYIGVTGLFTVVLNGFNFAWFLPSILSGGLMLGAIFMATDYTTTPNTQLGNVVYFVALGLITALLRHNNGTEVVSFAILLMNLVVPLIDKYIVPKPFGYVKPAKKEGK